MTTTAGWCSVVELGHADEEWRSSAVPASERNLRRGFDTPHSMRAAAPLAFAGKMRVALLGVVLLWSAAAQTATQERFEAEDLFELEIATDPQIAPDGDTVAYVRMSNDIRVDRAVSLVWLVDVASAEQRPIDTGAQTQRLPRWSPDAQRLAMVSVASDGSARIVTYSRQNRSVATVVELPRAPTSIAWSPDGRAIAYSLFVTEDPPVLGEVLRAPEGASWAPPVRVVDSVTYRADGAGLLDPGALQIFVADVAGGEPRRLTDKGYRKGVADSGDLGWSRDGNSLYFSGIPVAGSERESYDSEIFAVDVKTRAVRPVTDRRGPDTALSVSPDGKLIAFSGYDDRNLGHHDPGVFVVPANGSGTRALTAGRDRAVSAPIWSNDGRSVFALLDDDASRSVVRISLDGKMETVATGLTGDRLYLPYTGGAFSVASDGTVAYTGGTFDRPAEIMVVQGGERRQLTHNNDDVLAGKQLATVRELGVTSFDGKPIDAWVALPPGFDPARTYPMILEIHGGPHGAYGPSFSTDFQLFAAAGYVVLFVNPRGSTTYGSEFANLIHHQFPGRDYDDLMSAVDAAVSKLNIDKNRLFVTGGSGGGLLTAWIVGKTNRFQAAAAYKPVVNWSSLVLTSDLPNVWTRYYFGKEPWEDPQAYWQRSPLSLAGKIETPTLVLVGTRDHRTPPSEAEQLYQALKLRRVPSALVLIPDASHGGALRPSQDIARVRATLAWFEKHGD